MSPLLVSLLLILGLVFPLIGAAALRLFAPRMSQRQIIGFAVLLVLLPVVSVVTLSRANIASVQVAGVTLVLAQPTIGPIIPQDVLDALPTEDQPSIGDDETAVATPGKLSSPEDATAPVAAETAAAATVAPTVATVETVPPTPEPPTATLEPPTPTPEPPTATPVPPTPEPPTVTPQPAAPSRRTYTVQQGDTLRGIAEKFDVTVAALLRANNLTAAQADSIRPGQELVIP